MWFSFPVILVYDNKNLKMKNELIFFFKDGSMTNEEFASLPNVCNTSL